MGIPLSKFRPAWLLMKFPFILGPAFLMAWHPLTGSPGPAAQLKSGTTLRVDVALVTVEAIVLDKKGVPVRNLKKENFQLFEDGKEQVISTFDEVSADPNQAATVSPDDTDGAGPNRGKVVLILFDDSHLSVGQFKLTRDSAEKYVKEHMRPQDLFAVASYNVSLKIVQNFTHDGTKVLGAIRQLAASAESSEAVTSSKSSAAARDSQRMGRAAPEAPNNTIALYQAATYKAAPLLRTLDSLSSSLAQVKGRKAIVLYSEEFPASANIHNDYMKAVNSARMADVAFYSIDARGLDSLDGAGSGLTPGPQTRVAAGNARARSSAGIDYAQFERQSMDAILRPLARETGGLAIYSTSDFNQRLDEVDQELSNYYVLGFQSNNPKRDGKFHELEVKADVKGATIKHRNGYLDLSPLDELAGSREEKSLINTLASPSLATQLPVTIRAAYFYDSPGLARILVSAKISTSSIEINKKGAQLGGDLKTMGAAYAEDGSVSARFSETQHIVFDKEAGKAFRNQNLVYRNFFKLRPGQYRLKLAIADDKGKFGAAEQSLIIPPMPESGLAASSLVVADRVSRLPDLIQNLQAKLLEESDPLIFNGVQVVPSVENQLPVGTPGLVFFRIYNLSADPQQRKIVATVRLLGEKGEQLDFPPIPLDQYIVPAGRTEVIVAMNLPFEKVAPGKYKLVIEAADTASNQSVMVQTDLQLK
jgi:VWFA-related protein